ncbi:DNA topoisomerase IB [Rhizobium setariae]|nr:DNA topoisomerase IB [Rhizobium setariae]
MDKMYSRSSALLGGSELVYWSSLEGGVSRRLGKRGFLYYAADGRRITDPAELKRFAALAVPPAYSDVVISSNPNSHLQAVGVDARGRKQYRYHPDWSSERGRAKFEKLVQFAERLPEIRERVDNDLRSRMPTYEKAIATVVHLLDNLYIRVGNSTYAAANGSFGLTTLRNRHLKIEGSVMHFRFKGKSGKEWRVSHTDRRLAGAIKRIQELPGQNLFQYLDEDGAHHQIKSQDVNEYIRTASGRDFTSRQFRTWGATCMAAFSLAEIEAATSKRDRARQINAVVDAVAAKLVNTRSVCRSSYIHPKVFEEFEAGRLPALIRMGKTRSTRLLDWMNEDEICVLRWLEVVAN